MTCMTSKASMLQKYHKIKKNAPANLIFSSRSLLHNVTYNIIQNTASEGQQS